MFIQKEKSSLEASELLYSILNSSRIVLIDVRAPEDIENSIGKIPNALQLPLKAMETKNGMKKITQNLQKYKDYTFVTICKRGVHAEKAADILRLNSFKVYPLKGGMNEYYKFIKQNILNEGKGDYTINSRLNYLLFVFLFSILACFFIPVKKIPIQEILFISLIMAGINFIILNR